MRVIVNGHATVHYFYLVMLILLYITVRSQNFASGGQIHFRGGQNFYSEGQITKLNWCHNLL